MIKLIAFGSVGLLLILTAVFAVRSRKATVAIVWETCGRFLGVGLIMFWCLSGVGDFRQVFNDFGVELPGFLKWMLSVDSDQRLMVRGLRTISLLAIGELALFVRWRRNPESETRARLLSLVTSCLMTLPILLGFASLALVLVRLLQNLS